MKTQSRRSLGGRGSVRAVRAGNCVGSFAEGAKAQRRKEGKEREGVRDPDSAAPNQPRSLLVFSVPFAPLRPLRQIRPARLAERLGRSLALPRVPRLQSTQMPL